MSKDAPAAKKSTSRSSNAMAMLSYESYISGLYNLAQGLRAKEDPALLASFKVRYKDAELFRDRYHEAFNLFSAECTDDLQREDAYDRFNKFNDMYYSIQIMRESIIGQTTQVSATEAHKPKAAQFCLPKIELGTFSGVHTEWPNFIALFDSLIHENQDLSGIQKMQYLLSVLLKEPLSLIKHLQLSEQNYEVARTLLRERYENKRLIADKYLEGILNLTNLGQQNPNGLRKLVNTLKENTQALKALGFNVNSWSFMLLHIISRKLPSDLRSRFELSLSSPTDIPSFDTLLEFLENQLRVWDTVGVSKGTSGSSGSTTNPKHSSLMVSTLECSVCKGEHSIHNCGKFNELTPGQRRELVIKKELCFNCLRSHFVTKCLSKSRCSICQGRHHTKLHIEQNQQQGKGTPAPQASEAAVSTFGSTVQPLRVHSARQESTMLLGTALVGVQDIDGHLHTARALLDSGSQISIMTENLTQKLRLPRSNSGALFGLGGSNSQRTNGRVQCVIRSLHDKNQAPLITSAVVLKRITGSLPSTTISTAVQEKCRDTLLPLADDKFSVPGPIDLLIGVDLYNEIFDGKRQSLGQGLPTAHASIFGWVLLGRAPIEHQVSTCRDVTLHSAVDLDGLLTRFWEIEEPPSPIVNDPEDLLCERHFVDTHSRDDTGRFIVRLPFRPIRKPLGDTRVSALKRFYNLERKLQRAEELKQKYTAFMADYLESGHMRPVSADLGIEGRYFIPHHGVLNNNSSTTKLRAVFDASAPSSSGVSLNQVLMPGPKLQQNIEDIILRFRTHAVVFTCDIKQMYRQIRLHDDDCKYQTIFWRDAPDKPLQQFELTTVTYGVSSSAYLAMRVVHELAVLNQATYPEAARVLKEDTFVDDVVSGSSDVESARDLQRQIVEVLAQGGLAVRKWASNIKDILRDYPTDHLEVPFRFDESGDKVFKVLGVEWNAECDNLIFRTGSLSPCSTKRQILSNIARVYDPCGYLAPVILHAKLIMQQLWLRTDVSWDDPLPQEISNQWDAFISGFDLLSRPHLPRYILSKDPVRFDLMGCSDASEKAFGAVVYLRVEDSSGEVGVHLLLAKTRVAPTKQRRTIPQLELSGAVLLVGLIDRVKDILLRRINITDIVAWCDSTIVLHWLRTPPHKLRTFEGNRVSQIQDLGSYITWRYVPTALNPADCASRGLLPQEIVGHDLWWCPGWMKEDPGSWPENLVVDPVEVHDNDTAFSVTTNVEDVTPCPVITRYSSLSKLQHVLAWSLRFAHNARRQKSQRIQGSLSVEELEGALHRAIKLVQEEVFHGHLKALTMGIALKAVSMARLQPFLDSEGLIRVGGRLKHSNLPFQVKHPILLPKAHHLTNLIIDYYHKVHLHAGASCLVTILRQRFWIVSARSVVRHRIFRCRRCSQLKAKPLEPIMGNLPPARVRQARPFLKVGIDFAGPFSTKVVAVRNAKICKSYICVFVCLAVKAIHIEVSSDLSTEAFLACFQRFVSRRGNVSDVYTDCGKNFQGAKRYLSEAEAFLRQNNKEITVGLKNLNVTWHMNPPYSPHMGGIWESSVKLAKQLFKRTIGDRVLSFEELTTVFARIEAVLNSRPLCGLSDDPNCLDPLTPGHFLIGQPLVSPAEFCFEHTPISRLKRWQLVRQISQHFWRRWQLEYLTLLQQRAKWTKQIPNLQIGDLVLIKEENLPPLQWRSGRISGLHPGSDGVVRVVEIKTSAGSCLRSVSKVCPLPKWDTES